jgi:hypothetical protein
MKPGKMFSLAKSYKRMALLMVDATKEQRNQYKRMMIDAQLSSEVAIRAPAQDRNSSRGNSNHQLADDSAVGVE